MPPSTKIVVPSVGKIASLGELFLFAPEHALFLTGREKFISPSSYTRALIVPGLLIALILIIGILQTPVLLYALILALIVAIAAWFSIDSVGRTLQLCHDGKLIQGRIVQCDVGKSVRSYRRVNLLVGREMWYINALCGFRNPEGKALNKRIKIVGDDFGEMHVREGSPIAVLYLNDRNYRVL